jgi:hypothetical protein
MDDYSHRYLWSDRPDSYIWPDPFSHLGEPGYPTMIHRGVEVWPSPPQTFQGRQLPPAHSGPSSYRLPVYSKLLLAHPNELTLDADGGLEVVTATRRLYFDGVAAWWIWAYDWAGGFALPVGL